MKDSGSVTSYLQLAYNSWGYTIPTNGSPFVAPLTLRITSKTGKIVTATVSSITPNAVFSANGSL